MKKYILFFLIISSYFVFSEEFAFLIKTEGDIAIYRKNAEVNIRDQMSLYKDDIIDAVNGAVLLQISGDFAVIEGRTAKAEDNIKINISENEISKIISGEMSISDFLNEFSGALISRSLNMNLFIILDVSTSMKDIFSEVIKYIDEMIIGKIIIDKDYLFLSTFGDNAELKFNRKVILPDDYTIINSLLYSLNPDQEYTDIGLALETMDNAISGKLPYQKSIIFFITDGINNPSEDSRYYGYDVYKEGAFNAYTQIKSEDFKVMLLSIGEETAAKDLSGPLSGEYLEVSREMDAVQINNLITDFLGAVEMITPRDLGSTSANSIDLKVSFLSTYKKETSIKINNVSCALDNNTNIIPENYNPVINIKGKSISVESYTLSLPEDIKEGSHTIKLEVSSENNVITRSVQEIRFNYIAEKKEEKSSFFLILIILAVISNLIYFVFAFFNLKKK